MQGQLLTAARPYLQLFSLLTLTPPPSSYDSCSRLTDRQKLLWNLAFAWYTCCIFTLGSYVAYINIIILRIEVDEMHIEDFTHILGQSQKHFFTLLLTSIHGFMLLYFRRLGHIYREIATLELNIDAAAQSHGGQRQSSSFRRRLGLRCGLWMTIMIFFYPHLIIPVMTNYMSKHDKIFSVFIMLTLQLKSIEYNLFVVIVEELLLRLRHTLIQLQLEISACEQRQLLQALCTALRRNQQMLSRIWKLVSELESYFWLPILLIFLYNCLSTLHITNWAYIQAVNPNDCCRYREYIFARLCILITVIITGRFLNMVGLQFNLFVSCLLSQNCIDTYNSFSRIIHNIRCGWGKKNPIMLSNGLREYALQMQHLKLRFTCGSFFDINLKNFGGMVVTLISFATILIQFRLQALHKADYAP